ncbi:hypothetical protein DXG03_006387 [Asterophora parasitica]|uniref:Mitochondrial ATP synthase epsilon chain domain-containing protein n=1 Tax=Asterophora parasitica TaxID=117018 RepID=A0A9P7FZ80_9AGAR|nr:hypothetical protein DXG03_006387 [Asterophora parasitica]
MSSWRNLFSYNKYSQITARAVRASFKEEERLAAERRGLTSLKFQRWEGGVGGIQTALADEVAKEGAGKASS